MAQNISKYVQLNDFILLEYLINKEGTTENLSSIQPIIVKDLSGSLFVRDFNINSIANNNIKHTALPLSKNRNTWFYDKDGDEQSYYEKYDKFYSPVIIESGNYPYDTIKLHIVSGYSFQNLYGILLQLYTTSTDNGNVYLANFIWSKQMDEFKFNLNSLHIGNKFYDKYLEFKIPSIYHLGNDWYKDVNNNITSTKLPSLLKIDSLAPLNINFSLINNYDNSTKSFLLYNNIEASLEVQSNADNFNLYISESADGDYIEYYATWNNSIIGNSIMNQIETGQIPLYTSNDPNNNWEEFVEYYGNESRKWVILHELIITEQFKPGSGISSNPITYSFTQIDNFDSKQLYRPILLNSDIAVGFTIQYNCRLMNRMDGTQIIRSGSLSSTNHYKYGKKFNAINVSNISKFQVFNKSNDVSSNIIINNNLVNTKYVKVFYNLTEIKLNENNEYYDQGTYVLNLLNSDSLYKFKFITINSNNGEQHYLDLSGSYNYVFYVKDINNNAIEIPMTSSTNMNLMLGELEFKLSGDVVSKMLNIPENNRFFSIMIKNPDKSMSTLFQGTYKKI